MTGGRRLVAYLGVQGLVAATSFLLPASAGGVVRLSVTTAGVAVFVGAVVARRPKHRAGWWLVALSVLLVFPLPIVTVIVYGFGSGELLSNVSEFVLVVSGLIALAAGLAM